MKAGGAGARGEPCIARDQDPDPKRARLPDQGAGEGFARGRAVVAKDDAGAAGQAIERRERIGKPISVAEEKQGGEMTGCSMAPGARFEAVCDVCYGRHDFRELSLRRLLGSRIPSMTEMNVAANLAQVRARIAAAARACGRDPREITLVAVTKTHGEAKVRAAIAAGNLVFGENRVQEAEEKWPALKAEFPGVRLHLIGPLQSNKVKRAVALFDAIETVDRPKLAHVLAEEMARTGRRPACFIEVNTGEEAQKSGVRPAEIDAFVRECRETYNLPVEGLMCIPPADEEPSLHFGLLAEMARRNGLRQLSMGMSADFEEAIRFGATYVRVGTAVFGSRPPA